MKDNEKREVCPYNNAVFCYPSERRCESCGWNPTEAKHRLDRIIEQRKAKAKALDEKLAKFHLERLRSRS